MGIKILKLLSDNRESLLVVIVLLVLLMMIIPLTPGIMDFIIGFNITITVLTLMVVIYMKSSLGLTSFPSMLLLLTLIRIGITVSTSRLILLHGDAGDIVTTFGEFVVGGNLVVGIIMFITITIINFIVITKGSERVAEVAARFSLDAMPGKQMSIDSDLRANNITMEDASRKRRELGLESKLHGAMDGAMKFVKGDAIASMIDILINLIGGIIIGTAQQDLTFASALQKYSILTIGDGLVQQVPALLTSLTAGMMITQVSDENDGKNLAQNVLGQLFTDYKAIFSACALLAIMSIIPGMPTGVFMALMTMLVIAGFILLRKSNSARNTETSTNDAVVEDSGKEDVTDVNSAVNLQLTPLVLYLAPEYKNSTHITRLKSILSKVQQQIVYELGVVIPQIVAKYNTSFSDNDYQLLIFEIPAITGKFYWDNLLLLDTRPQHLSVLDTKKSIKNEFYFGEQELGIWINATNKEKCDEYKLRYLDCEQFLTIHFKYYILHNVSDFLGMQEVKNMLDKMSSFEDLIKELLRMLPLNKITEILQRLVTENISIRNFKVILDAMLEWAQREKETVIIAEFVRKALGKYIAYSFSKGSYLFPCFVLSHDIEGVVRDSIRYANNGSYLALDTRISAAIVDKVSVMLQDFPDIKNIVIITHMDVRRYVRSIIETDLPFLQVLSFEELEGHADFNNLGVVELEELE